LPELRPGQSIALLQELHILTREGKLNQDTRRKLKQVYHLVQFIEPLLQEALDARGDVALADHGAGKSYLGFILYDLFCKQRPQGWVYGVESRAELVAKSTALAQRLGLITADAEPLRFGEQQLGWVAQTPQPTQLADFASHCAQALARTPVVVGDAARPIRRVGLCTGGAQSYFEAAIAAGVDVFITGEISEPQAHYARECGVAYLACGHHATERYGVQALGRWLSEQHGVEHAFIDIDNPA
jgi:putative NIF3 family GTP cyclohydrolase 1 type 2